MARQEIRVIFNPVQGGEAPFSFSPERAVLTEESAVVDVVLQTEGRDGLQARFAEPESIRWITEGPEDLTQEVNPDRTILTLRGFPMNELQESIDYDYAVTVEYEGMTFSSTSQYPTMSCVATGGGGG